MRSSIRTAGFVAGLSLVASIAAAGPTLAEPSNDSNLHLSLEQTTSRGSTIDFGSLFGGNGRTGKGLSLDLGVDGLRQSDRPVPSASVLSVDNNRLDARNDQQDGLTVDLNLDSLVGRTGDIPDSRGVTADREPGNAGTVLGIDVNSGSRPLLSIDSEESSSANSESGRSGLLSDLHINLGGEGGGILGLGSGNENGNNGGILGVGNENGSNGGLLNLGSANDSGNGLLGGILGR